MLASVASQIQYIEHFSYLGIFVGVLLAGHIVPIPEDVVLLLSGYLVAIGYAKIFPMVLISIVAPILADAIFYWLSWTGNKFALGIEHKIKNNIFSTYKTLMERHTFFVVFFSRFIPGFRLASPLMAGFIKVPWWKFFSYNILSAVFYGPIFLLLGYIFHLKITPLIIAVESLRHFFSLGILVLLGILIAVVLSKKFFSTHESDGISKDSSTV